jgi:hypothetical protein
MVTNEIERGNAVVIAGDSFAIDDARRCLVLDGAGLNRLSPCKVPVSQYM